MTGIFAINNVKICKSEKKERFSVD